MFLLRDLLDQESLGLRLRTGGDEALGRRVSGAHAIEIEHAARWLAPDWVMLSTGSRLRGHAQAQRTLVRELEDAHITAMGFGVGLAFKRIPPALIDEAENRSYPIFEIPLATPFREIVSFVNEALLGGQTRMYQRLSSMQRYLVDALGADNPQQTVLERLSQLLDATVIVFRADGSAERTIGNAPLEQIWSAIGERSEALIAEFDAEEWHAVATQIPHPPGSSLRWLVVTSASTGFSTRLAKPAAQGTAPLLAAIARLGERVRDQDRAIRRALLDDMLANKQGRNTGALGARAAALGVDFASPAHVVVVGCQSETSRADRGKLPLACAAIEREFGEAEIPHLTTTRSSRVVVLAQDRRAELRPRLAKLAREHPGFVVGIGRRIQGPAGVCHSFRDAVLAVERRFGDDGLVDFGDFDLATLLVSEADENRMQPKIDEYLAPLRTNPGILATLRAYFAHDLDVGATAEALHVHPNTLRYRLARVEQLTGRSLKNPATIAGFHIALAVEAVEHS